MKTVRVAYIVPIPFLGTFVVNEMIEVQRAGHEIVVVPLRSAVAPPVRHKTYESLRPLVTLPATLFDLKVVSLALCTFFTHPLRVLRTLISLHRCGGFNIYTHAGLLAIAPKALATAWRLSRAKVDFIHAHFASHTATCAGIAASISGIPFSFTAHAYDIYCTTPKLRNDTLAWKLRNAEQVFAVSEHASMLLRQKEPAAVDRIHTLYVGIPMDLFRTEPPEPLNGMLRVLCIAHFYEKKGLDTLIDACMLLHDQAFPFHLRVYGDGPLRGALADRILHLGLSHHITLGSTISQEEVAQQMKACHIFVMPCRQDQTGDMDGIPTVFMEAMAMGRPVISCPISGIPELVRDGETGLLVPWNDPHALAAAVIRLAQDDALRSDLGRQARTLVERQHDQRLNTQRLLKLMTGLSPSGSQGRAWV